MPEFLDRKELERNYSENAFKLRIGKVASLYDITVQTLRHYDKIGLFCPESVSEETGYRYYYVDQLHELEYILFLRQLGLPLSEIKSILDRLRLGNNWSDVMQIHLDEINEKITALQERQRIMQQLVSEPDQTDRPMGVVTIEKINPPRHYLMQEIKPLAVSDSEFPLRLIEERKQLLGQIPPVQTSYAFGALVSLSDFRADHILRYCTILIDPGPYHTRPPMGSARFPEGYYAVIRFDRAEFRPEGAYELLDRFLTEHRFRSDDRILEIGQPSGFSSISRISRIAELMIKIEL